MWIQDAFYSNYIVVMKSVDYFYNVGIVYKR